MHHKTYRAQRKKIRLKRTLITGPDEETKIVAFGDAGAGHVKTLAPVPVKVYVAKAHMTAVLQLIRYLG